MGGLEPEEGVECCGALAPRQHVTFMLANSQQPSRDWLYKTSTRLVPSVFWPRQGRVSEGLIIPLEFIGMEWVERRQEMVKNKF